MHLKTLLARAEDIWEILNDRIRVRTDMFPNLLETVRMQSGLQEKLVEAISALRQKSWTLDFPTAERVHAELELSHHLHEIWKMAEGNPQLHNNINFLALKKDMMDLGNEIERLSEQYNEKIRHYNKHVGFPLVAQFGTLFRLSRKPIFEFEV